MRKQFLVLTAIIFSTIGLAGCTAGSGTPASDVGYRDIGELREAFIDAGGECTEAVALEYPCRSAESIKCDDRTELATFATVTHRDAAVEWYWEREGVQVFLVGSNWILAGKGVEDLASTLGGVVVRPVPSEEK